MRLDIRDLEVDDVNEAKARDHHVSAREMLELLDDRIRLFRNRGRRAAEYVMIGRTRGGRVLTVPIKRTPVPGRWRPVTAWESTPAEKRRYES